MLEDLQGRELCSKSLKLLSIQVLSAGNSGGTLYTYHLKVEAVCSQQNTWFHT
jgi:hypothetical protein